jgi:hypothetical protein
MRQNGWLGFQTDSRKPVNVVMQGYYVLPDVSGSTEWGLDPQLNFRVASQVQAEIGVSMNAGTYDAQWYGNISDAGGTHYTFARMQQRTTSVTTRIDYTMTPSLSLQLYAQPFITSGDFSRLRELADPRAAAYADRFQAYAGVDPEDFNFKQFRSNTVLRWEYRPGSVLFFVWQQGRGQSGVDAGSFNLGRDFTNLFKTRSDNTFLIKGSYWFSF